ncbi:PEP-CTERM sorting domain-containing protein [Pseudoduganella lutea]|uniref:PEP-CTERM sorting domain-containing protein n=2 Tax=Pseudoduganella lutea TaxID=321985 RepID=A0A4P6L0Y5_9BURK|nr:PEP-CTERM sorting domain-containing protein [Pseudoduganella lutea]
MMRQLERALEPPLTTLHGGFMTFPLRMPLATLALLLTSLSAAANGVATSSISNVRFDVLDLTPADGNPAGYDILSTHSSLFASAYTSTAEYYAAGYPTPAIPAALRLGLGGSVAEARTSGALADVFAGAIGDASLGGYGAVGGTSNQAVHFMLRPHTVLTIGGHLSTLAERWGTPAEYYDVVGMAHVGIIDGDGYTFTQFTRQSLAFADWPDRMMVEDDFMLAFANGSGEYRPVSVYFQALSNVTRMAAPVPEPAAGWLLCAGLLALAARRVVRRAR